MKPAVIFIFTVIISVGVSFIFHYLARQGFRNSLLAGVAVFILTTIAAYLVYKDSTQEPYQIKIRVSIINPANKRLIARFMIGYKSASGDTISPINFILYIQIINMQTVRSKIASYRVEAAPALDGPWKQLMPIAVRGQQIYLIFKRGGLTKASEIEFLPNSLANVLSDQSLQPHETISGWAFFERRDVVPSAMNFFRFHIHDTAGVQTSRIVPKAKQIPNVGQRETQKSPGWRLLHQDRDISKFHVRYYHSSYPN